MNTRYEDLSFKKYKLYCSKQDTGIFIIQDSDYLSMYWIMYENPEYSWKSRNFYNLTFAKENAKLLYLKWKEEGTPDLREIKLSRSRREGHW